MRYAISARVDLGDPASTLTVDFTGPPTEYQPLKSGLDQVLRTHQASLGATLLATFDPVLELSGQEVEDLVRRAPRTPVRPSARCGLPPEAENDDSQGVVCLHDRARRRRPRDRHPS